MRIRLRHDPEVSSCHARDVIVRGTGVWSSTLRYGDAAEVAESLAELEELGYSVLWVPDIGGDVFGAVGNLLAATTSAIVATGILTCGCTSQTTPRVSTPNCLASTAIDSSWESGSVPLRSSIGSTSPVPMNGPSPAPASSSTGSTQRCRRWHQGRACSQRSDRRCPNWRAAEPPGRIHTSSRPSTRHAHASRWVAPARAGAGLGRSGGERVAHATELVAPRRCGDD